jgi:hypothetical protein
MNGRKTEVTTVARIVGSAKMKKQVEDRRDKLNKRGTRGGRGRKP